MIGRHIIGNNCTTDTECIQEGLLKSYLKCNISTGTCVCAGLMEYDEDTKTCKLNLPPLKLPEPARSYSYSDDGDDEFGRGHVIGATLVGIIVGLLILWFWYSKIKKLLAKISPSTLPNEDPCSRYELRTNEYASDATPAQTSDPSAVDGHGSSPGYSGAESFPSYVLHPTAPEAQNLITKDTANTSADPSCSIQPTAPSSDPSALGGTSGTSTAPSYDVPSTSPIYYPSSTSDTSAMPPPPSYNEALRDTNVNVL